MFYKIRVSMQFSKSKEAYLKRKNAIMNFHALDMFRVQMSQIFCNLFTIQLKLNSSHLNPNQVRV